MKFLRISLKDQLSILFSALALIFSVITFYLTELKVENKAFARIAQVGFDNYGLSNGDSAIEINQQFVKAKDVVVQIAFMNTGNRTAIISETHFYLQFENISFGHDHKQSKDTFPFLLAPHELKLASLRLPIKYILKNYNDLCWDKRINPENKKPDYNLLGGIEYSAIDSNGIVHNAKAEKQFRLNFNKIDQYDIDANVMGNFPLTSLFDDKSKNDY